MYVYQENLSELHRWIRDEVELDEEIREGAHDLPARRIQEWLAIHGFDLVIDGQYGPVTTQCVSQFQQQNSLADSGDVDPITFERLIAPMTAVLQQGLNQSISFEEAVLDYAGTHLQQHPLEVGGQNRGPWVRLYMQGNDGASWAWCAGFVSFVMHQAAESLQIPLPFDGSFSCDSLAAHARDAGLFVDGQSGPPTGASDGSFFLVRRSSDDWTHVGVVSGFEEQHFNTIEGNTNDDGHREGYEVCARSRGYSSKDFLRLSHS